MPRLPGMYGNFQCVRCNTPMKRWLGQCPHCGAWSTIKRAADVAKGVSINQVAPENAPQVPRISTGLPSVDLVLGGGLALGSVLLIGGEPGAGKTTLLLSIAENVAQAGQPVLFVSGEMNLEAIAQYALRVGVKHPGIKVLQDVDVMGIAQEMEVASPTLVFVDSLQTLIHPDFYGYPPGSPTQLKACAKYLCDAAKRRKAALWMVGHVDKQGNLQGPNSVMHLVDTVLYLDGDPNETERGLVGVKNRYGATDQVGLLQMSEHGLKEAEQAPEKGKKKVESKKGKR